MSDESVQLTQSVRAIPGCGETLARYLNKLGIVTVQDLLLRVPFRYEDHRRVTAVKDVRAGDAVTVRVRVQQLRSRRAARRVGMTLVEGLVGDDTGSVRVIWFRQSYLMKTLVVGEEIFLYGDVKVDRFGLQLVSPQVEKIKKDAPLHNARIVPLYALTDGLSHKHLRTLVAAALEKYSSALQEWLPPEVVTIGKCAPYAQAVRMIHFPRDFNQLARAAERFQFERAFMQKVQAELIARFHADARGRAYAYSVDDLKAAVAALPFTLTADQKKAVWAIVQDVARERPMNRLLQGDVGCGKTVVAALAMHPALRGGAKVLCMAPTQLLAEQHARTFSTLFAQTTWPIILLLGNRRVKISDGPAIIIGTHTLIQDNAQFDEVGLVIVDEQHRFGVAQRKKIKSKHAAGYTPHFLSMTATPIPRSLTLAVQGSLAVSNIHQMPVGRMPIMTRVVTPRARMKAYQFVRQRIAAGEQVFVVAPLIEASDALGVVSATEVFEKMRGEIFKGLRVGLIHGRLKQADRAAVMDAFRAGELDVLVATAVIEVGVDVPNATVMWIEGAERFGLAQLHQFRGRVGRSDKQSYCFVAPSFEQSAGSVAQRRLQLLAEHADGFTLAEKDLELRGSGDVWGTLQSGFSDVEELMRIPVDVWNRAHRAVHLLFDRPELLEKNHELRGRIHQFEEALHTE